MGDLERTARTTNAVLLPAIDDSASFSPFFSYHRCRHCRWMKQSRVVRRSTVEVDQNSEEKTTTSDTMMTTTNRKDEGDAHHEVRRDQPSSGHVSIFLLDLLLMRTVVVVVMMSLRKMRYWLMMRK